MGAVPTHGQKRSMTGLPLRGLADIILFSTGKLDFPVLLSHLATGIRSCTGLFLTSMWVQWKAYPQALVKWDLDHDEKACFLVFILICATGPHSG